jgi:hypothetical protein
MDQHIVNHIDIAAQDEDADAEETLSPSTEEGPISRLSLFQNFNTSLSNFGLAILCYRGVGENDGKNFNSWTERVASRTLEGLEGHDASTQVEGNEQTRHRRLEVQARAVSQAAIGDPDCCGVEEERQKMAFIASCIVRTRVLCQSIYPFEW